MNQYPSSKSGFVNWLKTSITARLLMVGALTLLLLIPLAFVKELIFERSLRKQEVVREINEKWGRELLFEGPILKVPYYTYSEKISYTSNNTPIKEIISKLNYGYFFPDKLNIDAKVDATQKKYGIFESTVYSSVLEVYGSFGIPNFKAKDLKPEDILWDKASVILKTSNLKGIKNEVELELNNAKTLFTPKYQHQDKIRYNEIVLQQLESSPLKEEMLPKEKPVNFNFTLQTNGSQRVQFIPIGKETHVSMSSDWPDPSFIGAFLPEENDQKVVSPEGFTATWNVFQTNRQFEQQFFKTLPNLNEFAFGVSFFVPVDDYQKSERSAKYGFLVIALTFLVFFLIQTMSGISIHPFQYLMIGLALTMFYTLLVSISEHSSFMKAYITAGIAVVLLITIYAKSILKNIKFPVFILCSLTALYSFIYVIIQLEDYALLVGSIGLFIILALVMFVSRKIDWTT
ncbi:cell envelope integrity protein CreD [Gangjinia marincola]|uniref:Cell envelope integrity protein CreD n=1 Tax=Gangjinia marincola TaxID=578463 RepID=A0ABN1MIU2_9FLAO